MVSTDHRAILISKLSEKLAIQGLDHLIIEELIEVENISLSKLGDLELMNLPTKVRLFALNLLRDLSNFIPDDPLAYYLKSRQLFDLASWRALALDSSLGSAMALAAAAWIVTAKMMSVEGSFLSLEQVTTRAVEKAGFQVMICSDVQEMELTLLLNFNISAPTLCTWYDLFSARLDAIFDGALQKSGHLKQLQRAYGSVVTVAIDRVQFSETNPAYMIAAGSFCFALAVTGLVPVAEVTRPDAIASTQISENSNIEAKLAWFSQSCRSEDIEASTLPASAILAATQVAVHCSAKRLQLATTILVAQM